MKKFHVFFISFALISTSISALAHPPTERTSFDLKSSKITEEVAKIKTKSGKIKAQAELLASQLASFPDSLVQFDAYGRKIEKRELEFYPQGKVKNILVFQRNDVANTWSLESKEYYEYDANGNETCTEFYDWNRSVNGWVGTSKELQEYDNKNRETRNKNYKWDSGSQNWKTEAYYEAQYAYNDAGQRTLYKRTNVEEVSGIKNVFEELSEYGLKGKQTVYDQSSTRDGAVVYRYRLEWEHDQYGNVVLERQKDLGSSQPQVVKYVHQLDNQGRAISSLQYREPDPIAGFKHTYAYDSKSNVILHEVAKFNRGNDVWDNEVKMINAFDAQGNQTLSETLDWDGSVWRGRTKQIANYDSRGQQTLFMGHVWNFITNGWYVATKEITVFDDKENEILNEYYERWSAQQELMPESKYVIAYDKNGMPTLTKEFGGDGDQWELSTYSIVYPYTGSAIDVEEVLPITESGQNGRFELSLNVEVGSTLTGSFELVLPAGFSIDKDRTKLIDDLSDRFILNFIDQGNNSWLIEIKEKGLRAAKQITLQKIMDVAYFIDEDVDVDATHEIRLNDINFRLNDGTPIIEDSMKIEVGLRTSSSLEADQLAALTVYVKDGTLYVNSDVAELVTVYTAQGLKIYEAPKDAGQAEISLADLPRGIVIVKGGTGWVSKTINE